MVNVQPSDAGLAVGVDIGGTKIRFGLVTAGGDVVRQFTLPAMAADRQVMNQIMSGIERLLLEAQQHHSGWRIAGIGVGSAGQIDFVSGTVHFASDLIPGYTGTPIKAMLSERFGLAVYVDNDVNVLALAETYLGAGKNSAHLVCLALGTGVGGAVVADGKLVHGMHGGAGEIGHMSVNMNGPVCICGNLGCLELYASGTGIYNRYAAKRQAAGCDLPAAGLGAKHVIGEWFAGEAIATEVMDEAISALGSAVSSLIHILNPQMIVIGGGVAELGEPLFVRLREQVRRRTMPSMLSSVEIVPASLGESSNMVGAAWQVWLYGSGNPAQVKGEL